MRSTLADRSHSRGSPPIRTPSFVFDAHMRSHRIQPAHALLLGLRRAARLRDGHAPHTGEGSAVGTQAAKRTQPSIDGRALVG